MRNAAGARPALAQDFWYCFPPPTWRRKADTHTQVFRTTGPEFYKEADGTVRKCCFLVAQLRKILGERRYKSVLCGNRPLDPALRSSSTCYIFQELTIDWLS